MMKLLSKWFNEREEINFNGSRVKYSRFIV